MSNFSWQFKLAVYLLILPIGFSFFGPKIWDLGEYEFLFVQLLLLFPTLVIGAWYGCRIWDRHLKDKDNYDYYFIVLWCLFILAVIILLHETISVW